MTTPWDTFLAAHPAGSICDADDGSTVYEWRRGRRHLTVYVDAGVADYIQSWGSNIALEMDDGIIDTDEGAAALWQWLEGSL